MRLRRPRRPASASALALSILALLAASSLAPASASRGDASPQFQDCVASCEATSCSEHSPLPFVLRLTSWSCLDDCQYRCAHELTTEAEERVAALRQKYSKAAGIGAAAAKDKKLLDAELAKLDPVERETQQYFGKWPFLRLSGVQEPLSVLFSLLNLQSHLFGFHLLRARLPASFPFRRTYAAFALVSIFSWAASALFHTRDKPFTERLDYYAAFASILFAFFLALARLFRLPEPASLRAIWFRRTQRTLRSLRFLALLAACSLLYLIHILYLRRRIRNTRRFDYTYNMAICLLFGMAHNALWAAYAIKPSLFPASARTRALSRAPLQHPCPSKGQRIRLGVILALMVGATSLELLDFPPVFYRSLDAHALWHASTVYIARMWYFWLCKDAEESRWTGDETDVPVSSSSSVTASYEVVAPPVSVVANGRLEAMELDEESELRIRVEGPDARVVEKERELELAERSKAWAS